MYRKYFLLFFLLTVFVWQTYAEIYTTESIPNPKILGQDYYVSNPDGILTRRTVDEINLQCRQIDKSVETELCVVAVEAFDERLFGDAHSFATKLFNKWGIGKAGKNTGVLVFLARSSNDIQIITGGGIEGLLPDITCGQILDNNLGYLSAGDFDKGIVEIVSEISAHLTTDTAKAELLLGWTPKQNADWLFNYFVFCFVLLIVFAIVAYRRLNGQPGQRKDEIQQQTETLQTISGWVSIIAPMPLLLFYFYLKHVRDNVKPIPLKCGKCGKNMLLLEETAKQDVLTPQQRTEDRLRSKEYDVWKCVCCGEVETISHKGKKRGVYDRCPACGAMAYAITDRQTLQRATFYSSGTRQDTMQCAFCGMVQTTLVTLPRLVRQVSTFGGGMGGGLNGGGRGSFGGGMSFGGGAGRKF